MFNTAMGLILADNKKISLGELSNPRALSAMPFGGRYRIIDFMLSDMVNSGIKNIGLLTYNKYKSPIIEYYLNKEHINYEKYAIRQVRIEHIIRIYPDADAYLWNEDNAAIDIDYLYDRKGDAIEMTEFDDWAKEAYPIIFASETGQPYEKDWADYHRRGLEMAQALRNKLSTDFDLWYEAPWEDKSGIIEKPMLIIGNY